MIELFRLYKYINKGKKVFYSIIIARKGEKLLYFEYDVSRKVWGGMYTIHEQEWFRTVEDREPYGFSVLPSKALHKLIEAIYREIW